MKILDSKLPLHSGLDLFPEQKRINAFTHLFAPSFCFLQSASSVILQLIRKDRIKNNILTYMSEANTETPVTVPGKKWYAVRTITGHEKRVKNYLDTEIAELGIAHKIEQVLINLV